MAQVKGHSDAKFDSLRKIVEENLSSGAELGLSIAVNIDGNDVVDIWGGHADEAKTRPWENDTIVNVWSSTKTILALAALICHDRGLLDVHEKVAKYWPEFAVNGKENIEVRHLLSHTSGLSGWEHPMTFQDVCNLEYATKKLAEQAPLWEPGTASGYHALTMGYPIGELIRRVTGKSLTQFVREDIAEPLNADFQIGAVEKDWPRVADLVAPPPLDMPAPPAGSVQAKTWTNPALDASVAAEPYWRKAEVGAANGHCTAMALNRALRHITLGGSVDGRKLLSQKTIDLIFEAQSDGIDLNIGSPISFGIGYGLVNDKPPAEWLPKGRVCFWGGWGGSIAIMDLERRLTITYVMNKMGAGILGSDNTAKYVRAVYEAIGDKVE